MYQDTIAGISTPLGEGGIGIVRLSGDNARPITEQLFDKTLSDHRLVYGHIVDPETGETVDEVLVSFMAAPHTYTREDIVEINCHGGIVPLQQILGLALREGARAAEPGEFTLRAFLNGRIDLSQAESVLDIVQARTAESLRLAVNGLKGKLSNQINAIRDELLSILAYLTARIDFPDDEVPEQDVMGPIVWALEQIQELIAGADAGIIYRQGIRTAIAGRPNVGKSSLLNLLLRESRAIVTPVPGTTRDTLEEVVNLNGVPFVLVDTAGIIESQDVVESLGIERSRKAIEQASLVLLVIDASEPLNEADREIFALLEGKTAVAAANKSDLPRAAELAGLTWPIVSTSAVTGEGLVALEEKMVELAMGGKVTASDVLLVTSVRHKEALQRAEKHLASAGEGLQLGVPEDLITIDLTAALNALGEITGQTVSEGLLDAIFSRFCIGK
ncbi:MAG: tRNA uridine-5-carboxymethylaminomethyl(34) synthesis GTPase MnmE [Dehalococcoidia bacterium]